jgi:hypothetical protein
MFYWTVCSFEALTELSSILEYADTALVPLYMTKYREQMLSIISQEINRVYHLFLRNNPNFLAKGGKVSILGHSLGVRIRFIEF